MIKCSDNLLNLFNISINRMRKRQQERLKDITIDHIYDYYFNELVRVLEGEKN